MSFPSDFLWGAATAAYQVEGSPLADGAGPNIWHRFSHIPGNTVNGHTGDIACDHYNRWRDDVRLMKRLGLTAYRFSVAWARVFPDGTGAVNRKGLDFYQRLVDELLENGIKPNVTLYHWDLPAAIDDRGGWLHPDVASWFADYADTLFRALDDRVEMWATINEPWVVVDGGYLHGIHAPGHRSVKEAPVATHNLLRAHGAAVSAYRAVGRHRIGIVVNLEPKYPVTDRLEDREAARRGDAYMNRQYLDPLFLGSYPEEMPELFGEAWPLIDPEDFTLIRQPIDFLGINYYSRGLTKSDPTVPVTRAATVKNPGATYTAMDWEVFPKGLTDILVWVRERYGKFPIYITENGSAFPDPDVAHGGRVDDPQRVAYLRDHLAAVREAIARDVDVRGYFAWSLLDNFEWSFGYTRRFGIVHVNYQTLQRTIKESGHFYSEVIRSNGAKV